MDWTLFVEQMALQIEAGKREQAARDAVRQAKVDKANRAHEVRRVMVAAKREARGATACQ
jgi:hypothetical protein